MTVQHTDPATAEDRIAEIRRQHVRTVDYDSDEYGRDYTIESCSFCENDEWPCNEAFLLSELEAAQARLAERDSLIRDLYDKGECWFDHHGYCQEHGWFETEPSCPHGRARALGLGEEDDEPDRACDHRQCPPNECRGC